MYNQFDGSCSHISKWPDGRPRRVAMVESSNPTTGAPRVAPVNRFLKKGALTFGACLALADEVFAQQGGGSPWTQAVQALQAALSRPNATGLGLVAIVVGGLIFAFGEGRGQ